MTGPEGARVGQTFAELGGADMACEAGAGELGGRTVCRGEADGVRYVFAAPATAGADARAPAEALGGAFLERLVWQADG